MRHSPNGIIIQETLFSQCPASSSKSVSPVEKAFGPRRAIFGFDFCSFEERNTDPYQNKDTDENKLGLPTPNAAMTEARMPKSSQRVACWRVCMMLSSMMP